jgi:stalled ribosome rescue protein Dom34
MTFHACIWIDHKHARIFEVGTVEKASPDSRMVAHLHAHDSRIPGSSKVDAAMLRQIAETVAEASAILIMGPGTARLVLADFLQEHHPGLASRIWGMEATDHPTDAQIMARARAFFARAKRMHA